MLATSLLLPLALAGFAIGQSSNSTAASFNPPLDEVTKSTLMIDLDQ